ncbi:MAG: NADH-quinone oxidoreductase subunit NuoG [Armatimonadota bacterium]
MPKVIIDGTEYEVNPGRNMLEAALDNGLDLPYFCWHPAMGSVGSCRLCAVRVYKDENDTKGKIQMACMTPAVDGTRMSMNDPEATEFRRYVIEWLMTNHPHDCPVCDEGGECHLQDMTSMCGQVDRRYNFKKRTYTNQYLGPFVNHEMNRCIQCYRCVRFYRDLAGGRDLNVLGSKNYLYFGREADGVLESEFSGNLVEVCPTGVFTDKTYGKHYTRKWDLETAPSVCIHCGLGCNTIPGAHNGLLRRVTARFNGDVNGYFLCDRGRFGYEFVNSERRQRIAESTVNGRRSMVSFEHATSAVRQMLSEASGVIGIGSPRASLEANYALMKLVGRENFSTGLSEIEHNNVQLALDILNNGPARTPSLGEVEDADVVLILGADPTNEAPMLDFAIRQAMHKAPLDIARKLKIPDWDANAVANALQNAKGKLYISTPWSGKLDAIAAGTAPGSASEIAQFGLRIADTLRTGWAAEGELSSRIAADLAEARRPLVVTSISAGADILKAAANIAWALCEKGKDCWLSVIVPEANTVGVGMLGGMSVAEALETVESGKADTLVVLENDLTRRAGSTELESALAKIKNLIVLDCISTQTTSRADIVLPVSAYVETDGTFVSSEGRAQRFFQVFMPKRDVKPAWSVLQDLGGTRQWASYGDVLAELALAMPEFEKAVEAAEPFYWRTDAGQKVARESHRCTGRTAKDANMSIHEPQPPDDSGTPFAFSMEGTQNPPPPSLIPRFWYPGWNSVNSINKFQIEVGGALHGGNPGKRLIEPSARTYTPFEIGETQQPDMPRPRIFGSEELSSLAPAIVERMSLEDAGGDP